MSWSNTYSHTLAIAIDILTASIFWNVEDVTVSSLCGLALRSGRSSSFLGRLGRVLNRIQSNHCELAIAADLARAEACRTLLTVPKLPTNV
jgi:hypothetical protein